MKTKVFVAALFMSTLGVMNADAQTKPKDAKDQNEKKFDDSNVEKDTKWAVWAAESGMKEVRVSELALKKATNAKIKELAQHMVDDHTKANAELADVAAKKNITLPTELSKDAQNDFDKLNKKEGAEFDKAFAEAMVSDHKKVLDEFQKEADKGNDTELKGWAAGKLGALKMHLEMAKAAEDAVKNSK